MTDRGPFPEEIYPVTAGVVGVTKAVSHLKNEFATEEIKVTPVVFCPEQIASEWVTLIMDGTGSTVMMEFTGVPSQEPTNGVIV
jgi:hypothetical protein